MARRPARVRRKAEVMNRGMLTTTLVLALGCGGGSGPGDGGLILRGSGGTGGGGGVGGGSGCAIACLATLANLVDACPTTGTCTQQEVSSTVINVCYDNGVKMNGTLTSNSTTSLAMSINVKNGSSPCYGLAVSESSAGDITMTFKTTAGSIVATLGVSAAGTTTVTCPGGQATAIDATVQASCASALGSANSAGGGTTSSCSVGTCTY
jgi:hypothetical protein